VLDLFLAQEAERMRKTTGAVERVEEQCHPLNGLNFSQVSGGMNAGLYPPFFLLHSLPPRNSTEKCEEGARPGQGTGRREILFVVVKQAGLSRECENRGGGGGKKRGKKKTAARIPLR